MRAVSLLSAALLSAGLLLVAGLASAQSTLPSQPHLLVKGQASRTVMPDRFGVQVDLAEIDTDAGAARERVAANVSAVLAGFRRHKALDESIRADNLVVAPESRYENGQQVSLGSRVSRTLRAQFTDMRDLQAFLGVLVASERVQLRTLSPQFANWRPLRAELKAEAARQARASAEGLAGAYGSRITGLYTISDVAPNFAYGVHAGTWPAAEALANGDVVPGPAAPAPPPPPVSVSGSRTVDVMVAAPITLTENVYAIFLIGAKD